MGDIFTHFVGPGVMTGQANTYQRTASRRFIRRLLLWGVLPLCLLVFASVSSLYLLCVYRPELVTATVQRHLSDATGMPWRIKGEIRPVFSPGPGLVVSDVSLVAASFEQMRNTKADLPLVHVSRLRLYVDPDSLLDMTPRFRLIEFEDPVINLAYDQENRPLWLPYENAPSEEAAGAAPDASATAAPVPDVSGPNGSVSVSSAPDALSPNTSARDAVSPGALSDAPEPDSAAPLKFAADTICALPPAAMQPMIIKNGSVMHYGNDGSLLLSFTGIDGVFDPAAEKDNLRLNTAFALPDADLVVRFFLSARVGCEGIPARGTLSGRLEMTPPGSRTLPAEFESSFVWQDDGRHVLLPDFRLLAETDSITANLVADLAVPECTGKVQIHKISLPRWFEFGRVLPPGLRQTLDGLVGEFDLQLDLTKAEARNLRGIAGPLAVTGYVGTPDFSAPVVVVDLDVDRANLDLIFPFLAAVGKFVPDPVPPEFDHPPLAPYPEDPAAPASGPADPGVDVGYNVTVRVARPRVHDVDGGPLEVLVFPTTVKGADKTRVAFTVPSILGGSVKGRLDIDERSILMHYDATDMELHQLPENADNTVKIAGKVTGTCEIDIPMLKNSELADDWPIRVNAAINGLDITGHYAKAPWRLSAGSAKAEGGGMIHSVRSNGIRIEGVWNLAASGIKTSWHPKGNDAISGKFDGGLFWLPVAEAPRMAKKELRKIEKRGVDKVAGALQASGSLMVPLGTMLKPVTGKMNTFLDWRLYDETISLQDTEFEGFGSYLQGRTDVDFSDREVTLSSDLGFKINPRALLKGWNAEPPASVQAPRLLTGKSVISSKSGFLRFDKIKAEADGSPVTGEISWQSNEAGAGNGGSGLWTFRLSADYLDLDKYFPPSAPLPPGKRPPLPSKQPWNLTVLKGMAFDAQVFLFNAKKDGLTFGQTKVTAALQRDRFSVYAESKAFYGGQATFVFQGTAVPERSQVTLRKGLSQIENADIGKVLYDYNKETGFGGRASLVVDVSGTMGSDADVPAKLSGVWNLNIADGLYPAFLSGGDSTLRNTFSTASVGGALDRGVLRSNTFKLTGPVVDMTGGGWLDLNTKDYDIEVSATFAKVPTVPVRFYGSLYAPRMKVRGVDMVVETVQNAGSTVFGLVKGVLLLPAHAVNGISTLIGGDEDKKQPARTAPLAPVRQQTGHPGQ